MRRLVLLVALAAALTVMLCARGASRPEPVRAGDEAVRIVIDHGTVAGRGSVVIARADLAVLLAAVTIIALASLGMSPMTRARRIPVPPARSDRSRAPPSR
jgi:hypothetical protein